MGNAKANIDTTGPICLKRIISFFCLFVLVYGLLIAPWPGLGTAYSKLYRAEASFLFGSFGPTGVVCFRESHNSDYVINVDLYNRARRDKDGKVVGLRTSHDIREDGYIYTVFMVALILATPISWKRKGWALFWGLIFIHCFIALKLAFRLLYAFNNEPQLSLFVLNPFWKCLLATAHGEFAVSVTFGFIVCFFIWILVSFRREDFAALLLSDKK